MSSLVFQWFRIALQCKGHHFDPWLGKIPRAIEQLSPCATTTTKPTPQLLKPRYLEPMLRRRSHCKEKPMHHHEEQPPLTATRESVSAATKTQHNQKQSNSNKKHRSSKEQIIWVSLVNGKNV